MSTSRVTEFRSITSITSITPLKRRLSSLFCCVLNCVCISSALALIVVESSAQTPERTPSPAPQIPSGSPSSSTLSSSSTFQVSGEVFGGLIRSRSLDQSFQAFELERTELGLQSSPDAEWGGELRLESVRSAGRDSLMGVDGDSLLIRVKRAWAFGSTRRGDWSAQLRAGLIHDSWHELVMSAYPLRAVGPTQGEREGFQETSDLGAALSLGWRRHRLFLSLTNGEGRRYQEQNRGKDLLVGVALSAPLSSPQQTLNVSAAYRDGSRGVSSGQNHRLYIAGWLMSPTLQLGLIGARAWGLRDRPTLSAASAQGWVSYALSPKWATIFMSGEWLSYEPGDLSVIDLSADGVSDPLPSMSQDLDRSAMRWSGGVSQVLYMSSAQPQLSPSGVMVRVFERFEYQGESNLKSPVFGVPQLASEWRLSLLFSLNWGAPPPSAFATAAPLIAPLK